MDRDAGQDVERPPALEPQPLDDIEAVELDPPSGDVGQVPAGWWWRQTDPPAPVEGASSLEDPADRAQRGDGRELPPLGSGDELAVDRPGAELTEDALFAEPARTARIRSSRSPGVRAIRRGREGRAVKSTRSSRSSAARSSQRWTVWRLTWNSRATARCDAPRLTAETNARRRSASCPSARLFQPRGVLLDVVSADRMTPRWWHTGDPEVVALLLPGHKDDRPAAKSVEFIFPGATGGGGRDGRSRRWPFRPS